jgi:hypothetical protein
MADEREISERYRELAREEPPRHVDEAILAAARRAGAPRARRWYIPLAAAAAALVLAVAVAIQVDRGEPDSQALVLAPSEQKQESFRQDPTPAPAPAESPAAAARSRESRAERQDAPSRDLLKAPRAAPASPELRAGAKLSENIAGAAASPEQWLQGIMDLRRQARDVEADQQLAEFRKRYPDYRIDEATMKKLSLP